MAPRCLELGNHLINQTKELSELSAELQDVMPLFRGPFIYKQSDYLAFCRHEVSEIRQLLYCYEIILDQDTNAHLYESHDFKI